MDPLTVLIGYTYLDEPLCDLADRVAVMVRQDRILARSH